MSVERYLGLHAKFETSVEKLMREEHERNVEEEHRREIILNSAKSDAALGICREADRVIIEPGRSLGQRIGSIVGAYKDHLFREGWRGINRKIVGWETPRIEEAALMIARLVSDDIGPSDAASKAFDEFNGAAA
jgi:hypothetical protein